MSTGETDPLSTETDIGVTRPPSDPAAAAREIGPYRLLRKVGEGGMGEVWLADQMRPVQRQVAVKVIKAGMDTAQVIARFEAERQALAMMDHPAIAKVFDGGSTPEGRPYFVMEYVRGEPITTYCDRMTLPLRARLDLFASLCDGVQHAHQKGIIHRDLKPSNVLVTTSEDHPAPRIIDFGIAKATARRLVDTPFFTEAGGFVGTPEYMSPEQADPAQLDVDTRTDVYSLGVLLYELLVGSLPFDHTALRSAGIDEARRIIRDQDPRKPSTRVDRTSAVLAHRRRVAPARLASAVRGDLDWITLKALEKDRTRRYPTANALAIDIRRHLNHEPVSAGPPSAVYRVGKFVRRHRVAVSSAAVSLAALLGFVAVLLMQSQRIAAERDRASQEAATATQVTQFLIGLFNVLDPSQARGTVPTAREMLDKGAQELGTTLQDQPLVRVRLGTAIGTVYTNLGLYDAARTLLDRTVETALQSAGSDHPDTIAAINAMATVHFFQRDYTDAVRLYERVVHSRKRVLGDTHRDTLRAQFDLSSAYLADGQLATAEVSIAATLDQQRRAFGGDDLDTLSSLGMLQAVRFRLKQYQAALPLAQEVFDRRSRLLGADHPATLNAMHNLGNVQLNLKNFEVAERLLGEAANARGRVLGSRHPLTLGTRRAYANALAESGKPAEAVREYESVLGAIRDDPQPPYPSLRKETLQNLVDLSKVIGDGAAAARWRRMLETPIAPSPARP